MGQPVKLSDALVLDARLCGELTERSIAGQIELWAALGRAIEPVLGYEQTLDLRRRGAARSIADCLASVGTDPGRTRLATVLEKRPYPHYEAAPGAPGWIVRIDATGERVRGRFVRRQFVPAE